MPLSLEGVAKPGALPMLLAVGDLPERIWIKAPGQEGKPLEVQPPLVVNGRLDRAGAVDRVQFPVQPGQRYRIAVEAESLGSALDGVLAIADQSGKQLALVDDVDVPPVAPNQPATKGADPSLDFTVPTGTSQLVLELRDQRRRGGLNFGYRLTIEPATADFALRQSVAEINVPRGGSAVFNVSVVRRGYTGPIQLSIPNLPAGFTVQGGEIPANATAGALTISSIRRAGRALTGASAGKGAVDGREIQRWAEHKIILSREANPAASVLSLSNLTVALTSANPFRVQGPPAVEAVKGFPVQIAVALSPRAGRRGFAHRNLRFFVRPARTGAAQPLHFTSGDRTGRRRQRHSHIHTACRRPGRQAEPCPPGQSEDQERGPNRVQPGSAVDDPSPVHYRSEFDPPSSLIPGQTATLKGKLQRQSSFKDAVQLRLAGLPAGVVLAKPLTAVAANVSDFQIELKVDPKYKTATANLSLTASTNLGGMPYAQPPLIVPAALAK